MEGGTNLRRGVHIRLRIWTRGVCIWTVEVVPECWSHAGMLKSCRNVKVVPECLSRAGKLNYLFSCLPNFICSSLSSTVCSSSRNIMMVLLVFFFTLYLVILRKWISSEPLPIPHIMRIFSKWDMPSKIWKRRRDSV